MTSMDPRERAYLAAAENMRDLFGPSLVDLDVFQRIANGFLAALEPLGVPPTLIARQRQLLGATVEAACGRPLFRGLLAHYLQDLRTLGVIPAFRDEDPAVSIARVRGLATESTPPASNATPRRETRVVEARPPSPKTLNLLRQVEAQRAQETHAGSPIPAASDALAQDPEGIAALADESRRLIVLEEPAASVELVPIRSNYQMASAPIGVGGGGTVYRAKDIDTGLQVAVKVVTVPSADKRAEYLSLFQNEREIQGSLDSDAIVRIYKTGLTGRGHPYIVMELLRGGTLGDTINGLHTGVLRFHVESVMRVGGLAIAAVAVAHQRGVIHKDIKPDNFLFSEDRRRLKLGDFGISSRKEEAASSINGTIGYVPPETYEGAADTEARDVFALGVTLYELFTGTLPFKDDNAVASYNDIQRGPPRAPSAVQPGRGIPAEVDRIVLKALQASRDARYPDADSMLFDFVTSEVRTLIDAANDSRATVSIQSNDPDLLVVDKLWTTATREAIRRLERIELTFPSERLRAWRAELLGELHAQADRTGDEDLLRETAERIEVLNPRSPLIERSASSVSVTFVLDDPDLLLRHATPVFTVVESDNRAGVFRPSRFEQTATCPGPVEYPRGSVFGIGLESTGDAAIAPVHIPLPVRPGPHRVIVPVYPASELPAGCTLITAGLVPARNRNGSYSERIRSEDVRRVGHDFTISNLVTQAEYLRFLVALRESGKDSQVTRRMPFGWSMVEGEFVRRDGGAIDPAEPVRGIGYDDVLAYVHSLGDGIRPPSVNEIRRASRGNDARVFPWGDAEAQKPAIAALQFIGYPPLSAPVASVPSFSRFGDRSPFSPPDRIRGFKHGAYHLVGNLTEFLWLGDSAEERAPILESFPATRKLDAKDATLTECLFVTSGIPFSSPAPTNADIFGIERVRREDEGGAKQRFNHGFRWVKPLRARSPEALATELSEEEAALFRAAAERRTSSGAWYT